MSQDGFWQEIERQLTALRSAKTVADVLAICPEKSSGDGFFAGSGGDGSVYEALMDAGWSGVWWEAGYYYCLASPDGTERLTYVEGDLYGHDTKGRG